MKRLAVYCGSATPADPVYIESALDRFQPSAYGALYHKSQVAKADTPGAS